MPHMQVLILEETDDGTWTCTQRNIDVVGQGSSAIEAAHDYTTALHQQNNVEVASDD